MLRRTAVWCGLLGLSHFPRAGGRGVDEQHGVSPFAGLERPLKALKTMWRYSFFSRIAQGIKQIGFSVSACLELVA